MKAGPNLPQIRSKAKPVEVLSICLCASVWFWMVVLIIYAASYNDLGPISAVVYFFEFAGSTLLLVCALRGINRRNAPCLETICCGSDGGCLDWHGFCSYCCGCLHFVTIF